MDTVVNPVFKRAKWTDTHIIGILGGMFVFAAAYAYHSLDFARLVNPDTNLALSEGRIAHIPGEFERRSKMFGLSWEMFKACSRIERCDSKPVLAMRDQAIKFDWPVIYDRLVVYDDWGERVESANARDEFLATLKEVGPEILRGRCLPRITFENTYGGEAYYHFEKFECESAPAS